MLPGLLCGSHQCVVPHSLCMCLPGLPACLPADFAGMFRSFAAIGRAEAALTAALGLALAGGVLLLEPLAGSLWARQNEGVRCAAITPSRWLPLALAAPAAAAAVWAARLPAEPPALFPAAHADLPLIPRHGFVAASQKLFSSIEEEYARKKELRQREVAQAAAALRGAPAAAAGMEQQTSPAAAAAAAAATVHARAPVPAVLAASPAQTSTTSRLSSAGNPPRVGSGAQQPPDSLPAIVESSVQQGAVAAGQDSSDISVAPAAPARQDAPVAPPAPVPLPQAVLAAAAKGATVS